MGNQLSRDYDIKGQAATGGIGGLWKIYDAVKKSNGRPVSVWTFERKYLEQLGKKVPAVKKHQDAVYEILKREVVQLTRLRHPALLEVLEPLIESRNEMALVTERVFASLANVLGQHGNLSPVPAELAQHTFEELELSKGMLQVAKALSFLHDDAKLVHGNLTPEAIVINAKGDWKLAGFAFCNSVRMEGDKPAPFNYAEFDPAFPAFAQPALNYLAPEYVLEKRCDIGSDMWSFGCLIYALYNHGASPVQANDSLAAYTDAVKRAPNASLAALPAPLMPMVQAMLNRTPEARPVARQLGTAPFFDSLILKALLYMDVLAQKPPPEKAQFFRSLPKALPQFPERIVQRKVLPTLLEEVRDLQLAPFILSSVLSIAEKLTAEQFATRVLPNIKFLFTVADPPQVPLMLIQHVDLLLAKTPKAELRDNIMPLLAHALSVTNPQVQHKALKALPPLVDQVDYGTLRTTIYPKLEVLLTTSEVSSIRVQALICVHAFLKALDTTTMTQKLLPILRTPRGSDPAVLMATLGVLDEIGRKYAVVETIALEILPSLWRFALEPTLNVQQFKIFANSIRELSKKVEEQTIAKLEQKAALDQQAQAMDPTRAVTEGDMASFAQLVSSATAVDTRRTASPAPAAAAAAGSPAAGVAAITLDDVGFDPMDPFSSILKATAARPSAPTPSTQSAAGAAAASAPPARPAATTAAPRPLPPTPVVAAAARPAPAPAPAPAPVGTAASTRPAAPAAPAKAAGGPSMAAMGAATSASGFAGGWSPAAGAAPAADPFAALAARPPAAPAAPAAAAAPNPFATFGLAPPPTGAPSAASSSSAAALDFDFFTSAPSQPTANAGAAGSKPSAAFLKEFDSLI